MVRKPLIISDRITLWKIAVQPGEVVQDYPLDVSALLATGEMVTSATADDVATVTDLKASSQTVLIDVVGPANEEQKPVRLTIHGSLGSVRLVGLVVIGVDPFMAFAAPIAPNVFLRWRGVWAADVDYHRSDLVIYNGVTYLSLGASVGITPEIDPLKWLSLASAGGGGGGGNLFPDAGGSGRTATFRMTWIGPGPDDWSPEVIGVQ